MWYRTVQQLTTYTWQCSCEDQVYFWKNTQISWTAEKSGWMEDITSVRLNQHDIADVIRETLNDIIGEVK